MMVYVLKRPLKIAFLPYTYLHAATAVPWGWVSLLIHEIGWPRVSREPILGRAVVTLSLAVEAVASRLARVERAAFPGHVASAGPVSAASSGLVTRRRRLPGSFRLHEGLPEGGGGDPEALLSWQWERRKVESECAGRGGVVGGSSH